MAALPLRSEYRPTLPQLLAPRWRRASRSVRTLTIAAAVALAMASAALVLTLLPARVSYGGAAPFGFSYRSLYRTSPDPGGDVKVARRDRRGNLEDSFAVAPLTLPPYGGGLSGEEPLYAAGYIRSLAARYPGFQLQGEGKTRVDLLPAYNIYYSARVRGRTMWGRDVLLVPEQPGARRGVAISMLTSPGANAQVTSPLLVATAGVLYEPLRTFSFD
ncbi:MAG: hypothetical protein ACHQDY_08900 [Solirubrobacterales bacterium]